MVLAKSPFSEGRGGRELRLFLHRAILLAEGEIIMMTGGLTATISNFFYFISRNFFCRNRNVNIIY